MKYKTIEIIPPLAPYQSYLVNCLDDSGTSCMHDKPKKFLGFIPSGSCFNQHVGNRVLTVGALSDGSSNKQYFFMFSTIGYKPDYVNRIGNIWSSAVVFSKKIELIRFVEGHCQKNSLGRVFSCLKELETQKHQYEKSNPLNLENIFSGKHFLNNRQNSSNAKFLGLVKKINLHRKKMSICAAGSLSDFYTDSEQLVWQVFKEANTDFIATSFNCFADDTFDLCIIQGKSDSLSPYIYGDRAVASLCDFFQRILPGL